MTRLFILPLVAIIGIAGCGGDSNNVGGVCGAFQARAQRCNDSYSADDVRECQEDLSHFEFRTDATDAFIRCVNGLSCDKSDGDCFIQVVSELSINPSDPVYTLCGQKARDCSEINDDMCPAILFATDNSKAQIQACLQKSCAEIEACIGAL